MKKILLYNSGGGLGDSIQLFSLILSLKNQYKSSEIFYLGAHENHFVGKLKEYNVQIPSLNLGVKYFGFRWWHLFIAKDRFLNLGLNKIDLIIDLQSKFRNTIILKRLPHDFFYSSCFGFKFCTNKQEYSSKDHLINLDKFLNINLNKLNFKLDKLPKKYIDEANRLLPKKNYIGLSLTQGNTYRKKSWSMNKFLNLAEEIVKKNKIPVFFIEKDKVELINEIKLRIPKALFPELDSNISCPALVSALTSKLDLAISIDNGIMHMMGLANIPMIVLFGPTNSEKFSPKNKNVKILDSKEIYNSNDIDKITVDDVNKLI